MQTLYTTDEHFYVESILLLGKPWTFCMPAWVYIQTWNILYACLSMAS